MRLPAWYGVVVTFALYVLWNVLDPISSNRSNDDEWPTLWHILRLAALFLALCLIVISDRPMEVDRTPIPRKAPTTLV